MIVSLNIGLSRLPKILSARLHPGYGLGPALGRRLQPLGGQVGVFQVLKDRFAGLKTLDATGLRGQISQALFYVAR